LLLQSCSFPDTRPATNTFSWYKNSIPDGFPGITEKIIAIPAKRLGFPQIHQGTFEGRSAGKHFYLFYESTLLARQLHQERTQMEAQ